MAPRSPDFKRNKSIVDLISDTRKPKLLPETGWYRVAITSLYEATSAGGQYYGSTVAIFKNSWQNSGGLTNAPVSWYLSQNGEVRFRGKIAGGFPGTVVFTLPEEVRPQYAETFIVAVDGGTTTANVIVFANGDVTVESVG
jgi:hypothetical protein